ncbi:hypothetical protein PsYK624_022700 [Phanerochaete sordida]|uniref:Uncharacterized protein n=1 Tax=Phanerochaete sordida TaxID=48140 RepID=A0A9P3G1Y4_9APHY|nr:hypothetical protein PsYK624_022700 [Phanerochaete sordida]
MPTTRSQAAGKPPSTQAPAKPPSRKKPASKRAPKSGAHDGADKPEPEVPGKRKAEDAVENRDEKEAEQPPEKRAKADEDEAGGEDKENEAAAADHPAKHVYQSGTIERGHIYFFYRPKVELEEVHSVDDVQRFHILLVPRPPEFASGGGGSADAGEGEMSLVQEGADAVPAGATTDERKKRFRLIVVGKKQLPDPEHAKGRKGTFWATIVTVGEDLKQLQEGLGEKEYETKTKGTRHQGPARLAARGAYAIVNSQGRTPSSRETHLGYHLSHPAPENFGDVQKALGILQASSFVVQVKNPDAPNTAGFNVGLAGNKKAEFPQDIMKEVFGAGGEKGRESFGLRFATVERPEMLDYEGAELLLIAARSGEDGLETSLGEGRGEGKSIQSSVVPLAKLIIVRAALTEIEEQESKESIDHVLKELAIDAHKIPAEPLEGEWA